MKFYILPGPFRVGFGITENDETRAKSYTGAWGGIAEFKYLFEGPRPHIQTLERLIKTQYSDMLWKLDEWETEWLDNGWTAEQLLEFIKELITERHMPIKQIK